MRVLLGVCALGEMVIDGLVCWSGFCSGFAYLIVMIGSVSDGSFLLETL